MPGLEKAPDGEYLTDRLTAEAEKFIEANKDRPFFLYLPHYAVHIPLRAKQELVAKYRADGRAGHAEQPDLRRDGREPGRERRPGRCRSSTTLKLADNTIVIFTSRQRRPGDAGGAEHAGDDQRPAARGQGLPLRGRHPRAADRPRAGRGEAGPDQRRAGVAASTCSRRCCELCGVTSRREAGRRQPAARAAGRAACRATRSTGTTRTTPTRAAGPAGRSGPATGS